MRHERVTLESTLQYMKKLGMINEDGSANMPPPKMMLDERREKAKDAEIQNLVDSLSRLEARCTRDEFIQVCRIGLMFTSWGVLRLKDGVDTATNLMSTPFRASAAIVIPGLSSALESHAMLPEAIIEKLKQMGVDHTIAWSPSGGH